VPLDWLQLCVIAFGGQIGWEGQASPFKATDPSVTHHIVDRPLAKSALASGREYVQPQWVFDSINALVRLPVAKYNAGAKLPPHLSPFVDDAKEGYMPKYREQVIALQRAAGLNPTTTLQPKQAEKEALGDADGSDSDGAQGDDDNDEEEEEGNKRKRKEPLQLDANTKRSKGSKAVVFAAEQVQQTEVRLRLRLTIPMLSFNFVFTSFCCFAFFLFPYPYPNPHRIKGKICLAGPAERRGCS